MTRKAFIIAATALLASAAFAHQGVKNPAVLERMNNMKAIGAQMKLLGGMAKAPASFDAGQAQAALRLISVEAGLTVALFESQEDDPKSEAKPEIWQNYSDFTQKVGAMQSAADAADPASLEGVQAALKALGDTCKDCHKLYRE